MKKTLQFWLLLFFFTAIAGVLASTLFSSYIVTRDAVIENTLEVNQVYANKLAQITEDSFQAMQSNLEARSKDMIINLDDTIALNGKLDQMIQSSKYFNLLGVVNKDGTVLASSPRIAFIGKKINTFGVNEAFKKKRQVISKPYTASTGQMTVLVSGPLWGEHGEYLGILAGTIFLHDENVIKRILGEHFSNDGSYVYVVDQEGTLIYHPNSQRIGENVKENKVVQQIMAGKSGSQLVTNTKGVKMLAGYTYVPASKWGIISQTPYQSIENPVWGKMEKIFIYTTPFLVFFTILTVYLSGKLSQPLRELTMYALDYHHRKPNPVAKTTFYYEAEQLTETLTELIQKQEFQIRNFRDQSIKDPLTGLFNRRYVSKMLESWKAEGKAFSIIILDIDYFKRVNDIYGHQMGDEVIIFLANILVESAKEGDICARFGGEEFIILLPDTLGKESLSRAEQVRQTVCNVNSPTGEQLSISLGVGTYQESEEIDMILHRVDKALYQAKNEGRNRCVYSA